MIFFVSGLDQAMQAEYCYKALPVAEGDSLPEGESLPVVGLDKLPEWEEKTLMVAGLDKLLE